MRLKVHHETRYCYDAPVTYALQQLRLQPKDRLHQKLLNWSVTIEGGKVEQAYDDQHGNHVDLVSIESNRKEIVIISAGEVETEDTAGVIGAHFGFAPLWYFKRSTPLTQVGSGVRKLARIADSDGDGVERLHALSSEILSSVSYVTGETGADTSAEDAIEQGRGVCQDHAHIFVSAARLLGFPARYVSGYLMMNDRVEQDASHAWAEAHITGLGWVGFDISNGISPDERYVKVATGLDYRDAAPVSGVRFGTGNQEKMVVSLQVQQ